MLQRCQTAECFVCQFNSFRDERYSKCESCIPALVRKVDYSRRITQSSHHTDQWYNQFLRQLAQTPVDVVYIQVCQQCRVLPSPTPHPPTTVVRMAVRGRQPGTHYDPLAMCCNSCQVNHETTRAVKGHPPHSQLSNHSTMKPLGQSKVTHRTHVCPITQP